MTDKKHETHEGKAAPAAAAPVQTGPSEKEAKAAAKAAKKAEAEAAKAAKVATKIIKNGVTRPAGGTKTGRVWEIADDLSQKHKRPPERKLVMDAAKAEGINEATCATQYGRWRKFFGLKGALAAPAVDATVTTA